MNSDPFHFPFTENHHLRYGWMSQRGLRAFFVQIGECQRTPLSPLEEAKIAARKIADMASSEIVLCLSGGIDSECMALAFLEAGVPFRAAIGRYSGGLNDDDINSAFEFCRQHNINIQQINIDLLEFFEAGGHLEYARRYRCNSPQLAVHIEILSRIEGVPVLAWNPTEVSFDSQLNIPDLLLPGEPHLSYLRYFTLERRAGVPFFFAYSPELIHSFWNTRQFKSELNIVMKRKKSADRRWFQFFNKKHIPTPPHYAGKVLKYQQGGFKVQAREAKKTGFENAKIYFRNHFEKIGCIDKDFPFEPFDYFYRKPLVEMHPYPSPCVKIFSRTHFPQPRGFKREIFGW